MPQWRGVAFLTGLLSNQYAFILSTDGAACSDSDPKVNQLNSIFYKLRMISDGRGLLDDFSPHIS
jgi:hypothetical protein